MDKLLTVQQTAEVLNCHPQSVYRNKELPRTNIPGVGLRFKASELDKYIENNSVNPSSFSLFSPQLIDNQSFRLTLPPDFGKIISNKSGGVNELAKSKTKTRFNFGYGAIYQRKTKNEKIRWYLDYRDGNGKRVQKVASHAITKEEAIMALREEVAKVFDRDHGTKRKKQVGFTEFSQLYLQDYAKVAKKSWETDRYRLKSLNEFFKDTDLKEITPLMIQKFRALRLSAGNAYSGRFRPGIPTEAGHPFRREAATDSDVKPATFWGGIGMGGRNQAE